MNHLLLFVRNLLNFNVFDDYQFYYINYIIQEVSLWTNVNARFGLFLRYALPQLS